MDVDMIKSSASTALDGQNHHCSLEMMSIMMQMEKPTNNIIIDHQQLQFNNSAFLGVNSFSVDPIGGQPLLVNPNISPTVTAGLINPSHHPIVATDNDNDNPYEKIRPPSGSMAAMREMIFRMAAMQPVHIDPESIKPPKRRNVRISKDPQSVAARHRRERISERIRILQRLVPGGTKMDTASMLDEAIHYVKFLKNQVQTLEQAGPPRTSAAAAAFPFPPPASTYGGSGFSKGVANCHPNHGAHHHHHHHHHNSHSMLHDSMRMLR